MKIQMTGEMWPRDKFEFFTKNRDVWNALRNGEVVEIPDEIFPFMKGVVEVEDFATPKRRKKKDNVIEMNIDETISLDDNEGNCSTCP